jgi:hypothetical protein
MNEVEMPPIDIGDLYKKVLDVRKFRNLEELRDELYRFKIKSDEAIENFRMLLINFIEVLIEVSGNMMLREYSKKIIENVNKYPKKIVDTFIVNAYLKNNGKYREGIIIGDEEFFLNEELNDGNLMDYIFEFKRFWNKLDDENKLIIKSFLRVLCFYSDERFVIFYKYLEVKNNCEEKYKEVFEWFDSNL